MIDFKNSIQTSRIPIDSQNAARDLVTNLAGYDNSVRASEIPDKARRLIAANPSVCVAAAFIVGGILGWLTSRR